MVMTLERKVRAILARTLLLLPTNDLEDLIAELDPTEAEHLERLHLQTLLLDRLRLGRTPSLGTGRWIRLFCPVVDHLDTELDYLEEVLSSVYSPARVRRYALSSGSTSASESASSSSISSGLKLESAFLVFSDLPAINFLVSHVNNARKDRKLAYLDAWAVETEGSSPRRSLGREGGPASRDCAGQEHYQQVWDEKVGSLEGRPVAQASRVVR